MRLLVVSPDYASHVEPMLQVAREWRATIGPVTVATGRTVRQSVEAAGADWTLLRLARGSNGGIIRADEQPRGEDDHLRRFFEATRAGAIETLRYQAFARRQDLLFQPDRIVADLGRIIAEVEPDRVLVDHVAFGARLALYALAVDAASIVLGHPTALPAAGELYGCPPRWPAALRPSASDLAGLRDVCAASTRELTETANEVLGRVGGDRPSIEDFTALPGSPTIYLYPEELHDPTRSVPAGSISVGSLRRTEPVGAVDLPDGDGPLVLVALGTFLSARRDVLATAAAAAQGQWRLALASGSTPIDELGAVPAGSVVAPHLPQVALLDHADVLVTHGGNNSVTEACAAGVPMVVLPMPARSTAAAPAN